MTRTASLRADRLAFGSAGRAASFCIALVLLCALAACNAEPEKDDAADAGTLSAEAGAVSTARDGGPASPEGGAGMSDGSAAGASSGDAGHAPDSSTADGGADAGSTVAPTGGYTIAMCPGRTPNALPAQRPACDGEIRCGAAHCVPTESLSEAQIMRTPDCSAGKCIPDALATAGTFRLQPCTGELGEGRCIPRCFALWTNPLSAVFAVGKFGCGKEEVCAPCTSPTDQSPTGVCTDDPCTAEPAD